MPDKRHDIIPPALRQAYLAQLQDMHHTLVYYGQDYDAGKEWTIEDKNTIEKIAHSLAGSGTIYGYKDLSVVGQELDRFMMSQKQDDGEFMILISALRIEIETVLDIKED